MSGRGEPRTGVGAAGDIHCIPPQGQGNGRRDPEGTGGRRGSRPETFTPQLPAGPVAPHCDRSSTGVGGPLQSPPLCFALAGKSLYPRLIPCLPAERPPSAAEVGCPIALHPKLAPSFVVGWGQCSG